MPPFIQLGDWFIHISAILYSELSRSHLGSARISWTGSGPRHTRLSKRQAGILGATYLA